MKCASVNVLAAAGCETRYKNMILKVTPVLTKVNLIKGLSFEARVHRPVFFNFKLEGQT